MAALCKAILVGAALPSAVAMYDNCAVGTTNVHMPSPDTGTCFCGTDKPTMCQPYPEHLGLNRAMCVKDGGDLALGTASDSGAICGYFCQCANAKIVDDKLTGVSCCRSGSKFGLKNHTVIGESTKGESKDVTGADFVPVPSNSVLGASVSAVTRFLLALTLFATAAAMYDDCAVGTTNVHMPSPDTGTCFCGTDKPTMCQPYPEHLGLNRAMCVKDGGDLALGTSSDSGAICGYFCNCANAKIVDDKLTGVSCCRSGSKFGLKNHTVIGESTEDAPKDVTGADFVPVPSSSILGASVSAVTGLLLTSTL